MLADPDYFAAIKVSTENWYHYVNMLRVCTKKNGKKYYRIFFCTF